MNLASVESILVLWILILTSPIWLENLITRIIGCSLIGVTLLFFNFPDISEYNLHFEALTDLSYEDFKVVREDWNFEYIYDLLVFVASKFITFNYFYISIITTVLLSYYLFFKSFSNDLAVASFICVVSIFIYYIAFTLRTSIVSAFLAYIFIILNKRIYLTFYLLLIATFIHTIIAPFFSIILLIKIKLFTHKYFKESILIILSISFFSNAIVNTYINYFSLNEFIYFKLNIYEEYDY